MPAKAVPPKGEGFQPVIWNNKSEIGERRVEITEFLDRCFAYGVNSGEAFVELRLRRHF